MFRKSKDREEMLREITDLAGGLERKLSERKRYTELLEDRVRKLLNAPDNKIMKSDNIDVLIHSLFESATQKNDTEAAKILISLYS